jgi:hypothetical protein
MTGPEPPRLAIALLHRFIPDNEPLVGDLLEGFAVRQSRVWLWREVIAAIVMGSVQPRDREHPLGLESAATDVLPETRTAPLPANGRLGLFALILITALAGAQVWWFFVPAIAGGAALGVALTLFRRRAA